MWTRRALIPAGGGLAATIAGLGDGARAADSGVLVIPMRLSEGRFWTWVRINGEGPYRLFLDTASNVYLLAPSVIEAAGLAYGPRRTITGMTGPAYARRNYVAEEVLIGGVLRDRAVTFVVNPLPNEGVVGAIPSGVLMRRPSVVDIARGQIQIFEAGRPDLAGYQQLAGGSALYADVNLDGERYRLLLDTGTPGGVTLFASTVSRRGLWSRFSRWTTVNGRGLAEGFRGRVVRMGSMTTGDLTMNQPVVEMIAPSTVDHIARSADGVMGLDLLRRFSLFVDARTDSLWIKPNALLGRPFSYDRSGMSLRLAQGQLFVVALRQGTPAAAAGLAAGDMIRPPPGQSPLAFALSLSEEPGVVLTFQVERDGVAYGARMVLQDLI